MPKCRQRRARQVARLAVGGAVPAFHRQDAEAVADAAAVDIDRARRAATSAGAAERLVEVERDTALRQVRAERGGGLERGDAWECLGH